MLEHPGSRPQFYSVKVARQLIKTAAAQTIGPVGCWIVSAVVATEDAAGYSRPVTFWDPQLMMIIGVKKQHELASARLKAVKAGWLQYKHGTKGEAGQYFVTIPDYVNTEDDSPSDEGLQKVSDISQTNREHIPDESRTNVEQKQNEFQTQVQPFFPIPVPIPVPVPTDETTQPAAEVFLKFEVAGKPYWWELTVPQVDEWQADFPGLNVRDQCRLALAWTKANRCKTAKGMTRFLFNWLSRANDSNRGNHGKANNGTHRPNTRDFIQSNPSASPNEDAEIFAAAQKRAAARVAQKPAE